MIPGLDGLRAIVFILVFGIRTEYHPKFRTYPKNS